MTWEFSWFRPLLIVHAIAGFAAVAVSLHLFIVARCGLRRSSPRRRRLAATYSRWLLIFVSLCLISGALIYPAFRVGVRAAWMDSQKPVLTGLFEIKEHWGTLCAAYAVALALFFRRRALSPLDGPDRSWRWATALTLVVTCGLLYDLVVGLYLVMEGSP